MNFITHKLTGGIKFLPKPTHLVNMIPDISKQPKFVEISSLNLPTQSNNIIKPIYVGGYSKKYIDEEFRKSIKNLAKSKDNMFIKDLYNRYKSMYNATRDEVIVSPYCNKLYEDYALGVIPKKIFGCSISGVGLGVNGHMILDGMGPSFGLCVSAALCAIVGYKFISYRLLYLDNNIRIFVPLSNCIFVNNLENSYQKLGNSLGEIFEHTKYLEYEMNGKNNYKLDDYSDELKEILDE